MADISSNEDAAFRYVLGELNEAERREFESRMAADAGLRLCVGELETGVVAAAVASPRRRPPAEVWQRIEKVVAKEAKTKFEFPFYWFGWLRNGWVAATICLTGWLFYAISAQRHPASVAEQPKNLPREIVVVRRAQSVKPENVKSPTLAATNKTRELSPSQAQEILVLRGKISQLRTETTQLSRLLEQQRALLGESNRVKFYQLVSAATEEKGNEGATLPPDLQHAVLTALARELGWLGGSQPAAAANGNSVSISTPVTISGVDFIDLRPNNQNAANQPTVQPKIESQTTADNNAASAQTQSTAQSQTGSSSAENADPIIPAYVSGDNLVVALDPAIVPAGSSVTLNVSDASQETTGGSFILGNNPTVVTIPFNSPIYTTGGNLAGGLSFVTMSFQTPDGQTGVMQFFAPPITNP